MSERQQGAFYGDDGRPAIAAALETLRTLTGSELCANELVAASDYVEWLLPKAAITVMPAWVC